VWLWIGLDSLCSEQQHIVASCEHNTIPSGYINVGHLTICKLLVSQE